MTQITATIHVPSPTGNKPATGYMVWSPTRRRFADDRIILPAPFTVRLDQGTVTFQADPSTAEWVWRVDEVFTHQPQTTVYVVVQGDIPLNYANLDRINPETLEPFAEPSALWWQTANNTIQNAAIISDQLLLTRYNGQTLNLGNIRGRQGTRGLQGIPGTPGKDGTNGLNGGSNELTALHVTEEGPTRTALNATTASQIQAEVPPLVSDAISNDPTVAQAAAELAQADAGLIRATDPRIPRIGDANTFTVQNKDGGTPFRVEGDSTYIGDTEMRPTPGERFTLESTSGHWLFDVDPASGRVYAPSLHADTLTVNGEPVGGGSGALSRVVVLIAAGQSNMEGRGQPVNAELDPVDPRIVMWDWPTSSLKTATVPLSSQQSQLGLSPATVIARETLDKEPPGTHVVIIQAAAGGSGLVQESETGVWQVGYTGTRPRLFEIMMAQVNAALPKIVEKYGLTPNVRFIWHQGEADAITPKADYAAAFDTLVAEVRSRLGLPNMTVTLGGLLPLYGNPIMDVHQETPMRLLRAGYAPANPNSGGSQALDDLVHFHRSGVEDIGRAMYAAYRRAVANTAASIPTPPMDVAATLFAGRLTVTWTAPLCRVTDYLVEYSADEGSWTPITGRPLPSAPRAVALGITGDVIRIRVSTINENGTAHPTEPTTAVGA